MEHPDNSVIRKWIRDDILGKVENRIAIIARTENAEMPLHLQGSRRSAKEKVA
jgi:hypothetical protein